MSPLEKMLGKPGDPVQCSDWVHWWKTDAKVGDRCVCGKHIKEEKAVRAKGTITQQIKNKT